MPPQLRIPRVRIPRGWTIERLIAADVRSTCIIIHTEPSMPSDASIPRSDVAVIGAGPVGLFTVFECGMLKMSCQVIDALDAPGGQCVALYPQKPISAIPRYPPIAATELIGRLAEQAAPFKPVYHLR